MAASGSRLLSSNRAGWAMAAPAVGLILLFIIVPFALAFGLSFTNQRLFSPNPTRMGRHGELQAAARRGRADARAGARRRAARSSSTTTASPTYPRLRGYTRNNPDYPHLQGMQEWFSFGRGEKPHLRAGERRRLHEGAEEHLPLRAVRGAAAGRAGAAAGADDQPEAPGHKLLPRRLLHAGRGLDRRRLAALALHLRRRQRAPEQRARRG